MSTSSHGKDGGFDGTGGSPYLDTSDAARYLGLARKTLEKLRVVGGGPEFRKHGRYVRYALHELDRWSNGRARRTTSDPGYIPTGNRWGQRSRHRRSQ